MMHDEEQNMPETSKLADQNGANNLPHNIALDNGLAEPQNRAILVPISTPTQQEAAAKAGVSHKCPLREQYARQSAWESVVLNPDDPSEQPLAEPRE